jgi:O-antigen/teichoic acid export membrane protein
LSLTVNRELARASARDSNGPPTGVLLRTLELCYWGGALLGGTLVTLAAPWLAEHWVKPGSLPIDTVDVAIRAMGAAIALQAPLALYQGGLMGLERQVTANLILAATATLRAFGALAVLLVVSRTVEAYFYWQIVVAAAGTCATAICLWRLMPRTPRSPSWTVLLGIAPYALAVSANSIVSLSLTQLDKIVLSHVLSLEDFGYYTLAALVASMLWAISGPVNAALFPRLAHLWESGDRAAVAQVYRAGLSLVVVSLVPVSLLLVVFPQESLFAWTHDPRVAEQAHTVMALLVAGTMLNCLCTVPAYLLQACGRPGIILRTNIVLAAFVVPALLVLVPIYGAVAAACVWIALNVGQLIVILIVVHTRLLPAQFAQWLTTVARPLVVVTGLFVAIKLVLDGGTYWLERWVLLGGAWLAATIVAFAIAVPLHERSRQMVRDLLTQLRHARQ